MTLDEMKEFIRGKNVILVGNSLDSLELNHGDWIDGHDVVVRFGKVQLSASLRMRSRQRSTISLPMV